VSLHELRALADKSLLQIAPSGRYEIHELLRQYAADKLQSLPEAATDVHNRHCAYYTDALHRWEADLTGARQQLALAEMEADSENIRAAWNWIVEQDHVERLDQAMEGLQHFYWHSGRFQEGEAAFAAAAGTATAMAPVAATVVDKATCLRVQVRALAWQSNFQRAMGERDVAIRLQQQCLAILNAPALAESDTRLERAILTWAVGVTICMADYEQGRRRFEESLSLFRELDHRWGMAWALNASGSMSMFLGACGDAWRRLEEGLVIYRELGYLPGVAGSVSRMACIASAEGRFDEAEGLAREGVAASLEAGSRTQWALALLDLGEVLEKVAKLTEAHAVLLQSLALLTDLGHRGYITQAHTDLGSVELHLGHYEEARDHAQTGLALAREHGPRFCIATNLLLLGCLGLAQRAPATAPQLLEESAAVYREVGHRDDLCCALACLAVAALGLGDTHGARQYLRLALEIAQESEAMLPLLWAMPAMALLLASEGQIERAVELYALALRYPLVAKSRWYADVVGNTVADFAAALPAERVTILQERGSTRDLEATVAELLSELRM
jgi:tetratricopeptide (TPR) repeat protein